MPIHNSLLMICIDNLKSKIFMSRWFSLLSILSVVWLMGCGTPVTPPNVSQEGQAEAVQVSVGQTLPITAKAVMPNGTKIDLEVARTPQQQQMGLMFRKSLADNRGMLFQFPSLQPTSFWMKNTLIPLDMVFMRDGVVEYLATDVPPCTSDPCPSYGPNKLVNQVMELRGGRAAELGLKVGDRIKIEFLDTQPRRS